MFLAGSAALEAVLSDVLAVESKSIIAADTRMARKVSRFHRRAKCLLPNLCLEEKACIGGNEVYDTHGSSSKDYVVVNKSSS